MGFVKSSEEIARIEHALSFPRFVGGQMLSVEFLTDESVVASVLPPPLEATETPAVRAMVGRWQSNCVGDFTGGEELLLRVLAAVVVGGVDDEALRQPGDAERDQRVLDLGHVVVRHPVAAAQDDVAVGVAGGVEDGGRAGVVDAGEGVLGGGGADRVDRDLDVAVGAVLEADRHREAGAELAVRLALRGARADRPPGDRVGDVLRRDRVEELAADREAELDHFEQQLAGDPQAGVDVGGAVEVRVVDQALPADRRPRLLEVDAHDDEDVLLQLARLGGEAVGVVERRLRVVDAARADHDHQPRVASVEDVDDFLAVADDGLGALLTERQLP